MKKTLFCMMVAAALCLSGCAAFDSEPTEYTMPDEEPGEREVTESSINELANEYHASATLDPDFLSEHGYNASTFATQAADTQAGIAQAKANYALAEAKFSFWSAVVDEIDVNSLSKEFYDTAEALDLLLYSIADAKKLSLSEMIAEYGMTEDDVNEFLADAESMMDEGMTVYDILEELESNMGETKAALARVLASTATEGYDGSAEEDDEGQEDAEASDSDDQNGDGITLYGANTEDDANNAEETADEVVSSSYNGTEAN